MLHISLCYISFVKAEDSTSTNLIDYIILNKDGTLLYFSDFYFHFWILTHIGVLFGTDTDIPHSSLLHVNSTGLLRIRPFV